MRSHFTASLASLASLAVSLIALNSASAAELVPIVECDTGFLIGAKSGAKWLNSERAGKALKAGVKFRVFSLAKEAGAATGGKAKQDAEVCPDVWSVELSPKPDDDTIAIAAPWNPQPRAPRAADPTQQVYRDAVRDFLRSRGLRDPKVKITQILRIDLEGDVEEEVLVTATNYGTKDDDDIPSESPAGSYSLILLRRVVDGKVRTQLIDGEFYRKAGDFNAPHRFRVSALLDVDGDGKIEVIVNSAYYEGGGTTIYRCTPAKIEKLLSVECGV
jgi:hypothetical protein